MFISYLRDSISGACVRPEESQGFMQVPQSTLTGLASATSAVRLGLVDVNPVERRRIIENSGLKFRVTERWLEPKETQVQTVEEYSTFLGKAIASEMPLPDWADEQKLSAYLASTIRDRIEQDKELKHALEQHLNSVKDHRLLSNLHKFLTFMQERHRSMLQQTIQQEAQRFLASDLPLWVFSRFTCYDRNYQMYLDYLVRRVDYYRNKLSSGEVKSQSHLFQRYMKQAKTELNPVIDTIDGETLAFLRLFIYLKVWNSSSYEDIDELKYVSLSRVNLSHFREMFDAFEATVTQATERLFESPRFEAHIEIDVSDPTASMLRNVVLDDGA